MTGCGIISVSGSYLCKGRWFCGSVIVPFIKNPENAGKIAGIIRKKKKSVTTLPDSF